VECDVWDQRATSEKIGLMPLIGQLDQRLLKDLFCCNSVRGTVELYVRKRVTADHVRTADLVNECIMFRDGLLRLPDAFIVGDFTGHRVLFVHVLIAFCCLSFSLFLFLYFVYDLYNK